MITKKARFVRFVKKQEMRKLCACIFYLNFIGIFLKIDLFSNSICQILLMIFTLSCFHIYIYEWMEKRFDEFIENKQKGRLVKNIVQEIRKIAKELVMFLPVLLVSGLITNFVMTGTPENEASVMKDFYESPFSVFILAVVIGPIIEEFICRFLPYKFIKNKIVYIIVSATIFALLHVVDDPNAFYYVWFYMMRPLWYGYRYYETKDIWVTISMHSFNNFLSFLSLIF